MTIICTVEGCEKMHYGRGLCAMHYQRWRRHGHTDLAPLAEDGSGVCECPVAYPDGIGECTRCWHPIIQLHPVLAPILDRLPELAHQPIAEQRGAA